MTKTDHWSTLDSKLADPFTWKRCFDSIHILPLGLCCPPSDRYMCGPGSLWDLGAIERERRGTPELHLSPDYWLRFQAVLAACVSWLPLGSIHHADRTVPRFLFIHVTNPSPSTSVLPGPLASANGSCLTVVTRSMKARANNT